MAKQPNLFDQAKEWWQTDTAKAVATVIAVLLIPLAVIAWNYASNTKSEVPEAEGDNNEIVVEVENNADVEVEVTPEANEGTDVAVVTTEEEQQPEETSAEETEASEVTENSEAVETSEPTQEEEGRNVAGTVVKLALFSKVLKEIRDVFAPANDETANTETTESAQVESTEETVEQAEGTPESTEAVSESSTQEQNTLGELEQLPLTSSSIKYVVQKGDNVYKISMSVCKNQSFYISNLYKDYLKVGQTIDVECD